MPTYEYKCAACGHQMEEFQSINDPPLKKCPACRQKKLQRLISGGGAIVFKGSGFYQTDYRSESYMKGKKADTAGSSSPSVSPTSEPKKSAPTKETAS